MVEASTTGSLNHRKPQQQEAQKGIGAARMKGIETDGIPEWYWPGARDQGLPALRPSLFELSV